jgi:hypothetical protein
MRKLIELDGKKFGHLTVICRGVKNEGIKSTHSFWDCKCDCGEITTVDSNNLRNGKTKTCSYTCEYSGNRKHGMVGSRIYGIWRQIIQRCCNSKTIHYADYGGRGIEVCDEWKNFQNFYEDMKDGYSDELSIDRINNDGNYCEENCRWATRGEQARNRRNNVFVTVDGVSGILSDFCDAAGVRRNTVSYRLSKGMSIEKALEKKIK